MQNFIFCASSEILTVVGYLSAAEQQKICIKMILTWTTTIYLGIVAWLPHFAMPVPLCNKVVLFCYTHSTL